VPVDYWANSALIASLGELEESLLDDFPASDGPLIRTSIRRR
jgi:hypothetical protein